MALQSDYSSGTITIAANATAVTGSGTAWLSAGFREGDVLYANGYSGIVQSVNSNTSLTLAQPWRGGALTASAYRLRYQGDGSRISAQARQLIEALGSGNLQSFAGLPQAEGALPYFGDNGELSILQGAAGLLAMFGVNGSMTAASPADIRFDAKLSDYSPARPMYIPHRGGAQLFPENTVGAYLAALEAGQKVLELDVWRLSDGSGGVFHDTTVDRTTTSAGNVASLNKASFKALYVDAENWHGANVPRMNETLMIDEALALLNGRAILVIEAKNTGSGAVIVNALQAAGVSKNHVIVQSFTQAELTPAIAAGYETMILSGSGTGTLNTAKTAGVKWAGLADATTDADIAAWIGQGFKVVVYTITRRWRRDQLLALGVTGLFVDDPQYLSIDRPFAASDRFERKTWMPGMLAADDGLSGLARGRFVGDAQWGWADAYLTDTSRQYVLQGWACPVGGKTSNNNWSMTFDLRFGATNSLARWFGVFIADEGYRDRPFRDSSAINPDANGYNLLFSLNGSMAIYKVTAGAATLLQVTEAGAIPGFPVAGGEGTFRVRVTSTAIRLSRLNPDGSELGFVEAADASYRGSYFHFGRYACAVSVSNVRVVDGGVAAVLANTNLGDFVESGSNANGDYIRFASGWQICTVRRVEDVTTSTRGAVFTSGSSLATGNWPAAFVATPVPSITVTDWYWANVHQNTATTYRPQVYSHAALAALSLTLSITAVGRWF
jgi:glycerophosphoryl diester phosphodiesterase